MKQVPDLKKLVYDILIDMMLIDSAEEINDTTPLNTLGMDSLDTVDLVMALEDRLEIDLPDEKVVQLNTVEDIVEMLKTME